MENATRLDVVATLQGFLVVALGKGATTITLLESGFGGEGLHGDVDRGGLLEEGVVEEGRRSLDCARDDSPLAPFDTLRDRKGAIRETEAGGIVIEALEEGGLEVVEDQGKGLLDEGGARALGSTTTYDVETLAGSGKGHVEQIEIINRGLQMLLQVVGFVDGAHHVFLTIVDGGDGQIAEGCLCGGTPEHVARMFQGPVAEGTDDVGELQSL